MARIENKIVKSTNSYEFKLPRDVLKKNLATIVFEQMKLNEKLDNIAIVNARNRTKDSRLSCDLENLSKSLARSLKYNGFKRGDVIQLMVHNNVDFFTPILATWLCGGVASVVNPNSRVEALADQLQNTATSVIFCYPKIVNHAIEAINLNQKAIKTIVVVLDQIDPDNQDWQATDQDKYKVIKWFDFITESENSVIPNEENFMSTDDVLIFWSSGTTGTPKGALYNFDMMARMIIYEKSVFLEDTIDIRCFVMTTNFFHAGGFTFALINGIKSVNTIIVFTSKEESSVITSEDLFQVCDTFKPTILKLGSHHAIQLGYNKPKYPNLDLTSLLYVLPMGAPVHQGLTDELCSSFPNFKALLINYGSTEMFLVSQTTSPGELGKPLQGVECKIFKHTANDYNANNMLGPEEVGEIMTWTPYLMSRYLDKEQNDSYWAPDGFAHTGDLGFYKPDGTLVFQGRLKELIKYQGNHLYPNELEQIIKTHPGVAEVAVFGLPHPEVQELVSALVIVKTPNNAVNDVTEEDIKDMVIKSGVEDYKYIRGGVKFVDHIPKNATGKILRMLLPEFFKNH